MRGDTFALILPRRVLLATCFLFIFCNLFTLVIAAEHNDVEGLMNLDKTQRMTITKANGEEQEISVEEFERLVEQQQTQQTTVTKEPEAQWKQEKLADIQAHDPQFAFTIEISKKAFQEIQRHGYAKGYTFTSFSEKDPEKTRRHNKYKKPGEDDRLVLVLQAMRDPLDKTANTGTSSYKRPEEPLTVSYEVEMVIDSREHKFSIVYAWELDANGSRNIRLTIQQSKEFLAKEMQRRLEKRSDVTIWLLIGGVTLIAMGVVVIYTSQMPPPIPVSSKPNTPRHTRIKKTTTTIVTTTTMTDAITAEAPDKKND